MTKQELRKENLKKRSKLPDRAAMDAEIRNRFLAQDFYKTAKTVMTYLSYRSEPDTHTLAKQMQKDGKALCAPVCCTAGRMESYAFSDFGLLQPSAMGILEPPRDSLVLPEEIDLIVVPGCAFSSCGHRLGYGGGFYDRYLPKTRAITCGFFYEALKADFSPEETDIPLHYIITEKNIYHFI